VRRLDYFARLAIWPAWSADVEDVPATRSGRSEAQIVAEAAA
jgi:hypothetical protein